MGYEANSRLNLSSIAFPRHFGGGLSGAPTLTLAGGGAGVRATLTFGSVPSGLVVDGMVRVLGKTAGTCRSDVTRLALPTIDLSDPILLC